MLEKLKERKARRGEGGFTLIELLIVIIILAILAAIVVFAVGTTGKNASVAACNSTGKSIATALEAFKAQSVTNVYPATITALAAKTPTTTNGPWLRSKPPVATTGAGKTKFWFTLPTAGTPAVPTGKITVNTHGAPATATFTGTTNACAGA